MRKITLMLVIVSLLLIASAACAGSGDRIFGQGISAPDTVLISDVLAHPQDFLGRTIRVTGTAVGVCKHRGCWVALASDTEGQSLRVKVKDGEIVFPPEIIGETVTAEGVWTSNIVSLQPSEPKHVEMHKSGDGAEKPACSAEGGTCRTVYQLSGVGAMVHGK